MARHAAAMAALTEIASKQAGAFSVRQARAAGVTVATQRHALECKRWLALHHGVLAIAGTPDSPMRRLWAGRLALGEHAAVSHRGATWYWHISETRELDAVEFTVPFKANADRPAITIHRSSLLRRGQVVVRDGFAVTTPLRTLVDIGAVLAVHEVEDVFDRAIAKQLVTPPTALAELEREAKRGRAGCGSLRAVLLEQGVGANRSPSFLEAKALRLFRRHGLPVPKVELVWGSHGQFRLDFSWVEFGLVVEVDGWDCHASRSARQYDLRRRNQLVLGRLRPLVYTYGDIVRRGSTVIAEIRAAIDSVCA